jgi:hypothetical protein
MRKQSIKHISYTMGLHCEAWCDPALSSILTPPFARCIKWNFDVAVQGNFAVAIYNSY